MERLAMATFDIGTATECTSSSSVTESELPRNRIEHCSGIDKRDLRSNQKHEQIQRVRQGVKVVPWRTSVGGARRRLRRRQMTLHCQIGHGGGWDRVRSLFASGSSCCRRADNGVMREWERVMG
ncbi:hypothetical protein CRG98_021549 [Punica granatum]|uniref:Uncharacterized protein n=1 Tax=Punica granatum TaxID=22663 RepID=A0A2I0JRD7_PUNGR|nr:hypothetical protein CRG98_021549 [Punica granatum]